jgi:murein DD-endopeptidase MepM/ murein hydrolase activator NlpD
MKYILSNFNSLISKILVHILIVFSLTVCSGDLENKNSVNERKINFDRFGVVADSFLVVNEKIKKNETLADILTKFDVDYNLITKIFNESKPIFDFRKIQPDKNYLVYQKKDSLKSFFAFIYEINKIKYIKVQLLDSLVIELKEREVETRERSISGIINSSLYETLVSQNSSIVLAGELAEVYAWQIDFYTIQKGDRFYAIYEELLVDEEVVGLGDILAAKFIHKNNSFNAFLFTQNDKKEYFDEQGNSLQKEFLKAPLKYNRISSHYSGRRLHPILRVYKPHRGIDYAAAIGTPVQAVGDGIVTQVGKNGAAGRMVKVKHNSVYSSAYLHLSGYGKGVKTGTRIMQGQIVGYVGSSGRSTGPHLDFRFWKNGSLVNYLRQKFPSSKAVSDSNMLQFQSSANNLLVKLDYLVGEKI